MPHDLTAPPTPAVSSSLREGAWPTRIALVGAVVFALATVVAGLLHPAYDPVREGISALAATTSPSAAVMIGGFLALAAGTMSAGVALWRRLRRGAAGRVGAALVLLAGAGTVVALITAVFVLPRGLTRNNPGLAGPTRLAGLAALVLLAALLTGVSGDVGGLVQRAFIALVFGWPVLLAALPGRTALP